MSFTGFSKKTTTFLQDLKRNNTREWFTKRKAEYTEFVDGPAKAFAEEMEDRLSELVKQPLASKRFRIYRDVRFSKDKTPYNAHVRLLFHSIEVESSCGDKPVFCLSLEPKSIITGAGTGTMEFSKPMLERFRHCVDDEGSGKALTRLLKKYTPSDGYRVDPPALKRMPAGFDADHPRETLLRHKALMVWHEEPIPSELFTSKCAANCIRRFKTMKPVYDWINEL